MPAKRKPINIFLDLDQTIIASEYKAEFDASCPKNKKALDTLNHKEMGNDFVIFARPGLDQFLDFLFDNFNVSVWTAASRDYGIFIIENFILTKKSRHIDFYFYSYHTEMSVKTRKKLKDLSLLWTKFGLENYNDNNTFIIDDNQDVFNAQKQNTIRIKEFHYHNNSDSEFRRIEVLLKGLLINHDF